MSTFLTDGFLLKQIRPEIRQYGGADFNDTSNTRSRRKVSTNERPGQRSVSSSKHSSDSKRKSKKSCKKERLADSHRSETSKYDGSHEHEEDSLEFQDPVRSGFEDKDATDTPRRTSKTSLAKTKGDRPHRIRDRSDFLYTMLIINDVSCFLTDLLSVPCLLTQVIINRNIESYYSWLPLFLCIFPLIGYVFDRIKMSPVLDILTLCYCIALGAISPNDFGMLAAAIYTINFFVMRRLPYRYNTKIVIPLLFVVFCIFALETINVHFRGPNLQLITHTIFVPANMVTVPNTECEYSRIEIERNVSII